MKQPSIYHFLPTPLQDLACSIEGTRLIMQRYGAGFRRALHAFEAMDNWSADRLESFRLERLIATLRICQDHVPYYRELFSQSGFNPAHIKSPADITRIPTLPRAIVQSNSRNFETENAGRRDGVAVCTSGTTGAGLEFRVGQEAIQRQYAVWWRYYRWHGIQPGTWCAYFGGRAIAPMSQDHPPYWRINWPGRQILFSGSHLYGEALEWCLRELRRRRLPWIHGYPSYLMLLATHINETRFDLGYLPTWITTSAENLTTHQAEAIQRAFGIQPRQHYGLAEGVANISECPSGSLHVDEDFSFVEFVATHKDGMNGLQIVGTNFTHSGSFFLRYETGDTIQISSERCSCGRQSRTVSNLDGRLEDYIHLPDGRLVSGIAINHVFKSAFRVREAQIRQTNEGRVEFWISRTADFTEADEQRIISLARERLGNLLQISVHYCDRIERTARGKLRLVSCDLSPKPALRSTPIHSDGGWIKSHSLQIYELLPPTLQHLACSAEGIRIRIDRYGRGYSNLENLICDRRQWSDSDLSTFRDARLAKFVRHAVSSTRYYSNLFERLRLRPEDISSIADLQKLPILTKAEVKANLNSFMSREVPSAEMRQLHTSGTSGSGLTFPSTRRAIQETWATWNRYWLAHGLDAKKTLCAYFGGRSVVSANVCDPPFWRFNFPGRQILFSQLHLNERTWRLYVEEINRVRPMWFHGYPSFIAQLAGFMLDAGCSLDFEPKWITTGAENLLPWQAASIQAAFGVAPLQHYSLTEGVANIEETTSGELRVSEDFAAVEFIPNGVNQWSIVGTNFTNPAFPLIRYDTGDVAQVNCTEHAYCFRAPGRRVLQIDGREEDVIVLSDGTRVGRADHVFKDLVEICEAQITQTVPGTILVEFVSHHPSEHILPKLRSSFVGYFGDRLNVSLRQVSEIARTQSGKLRFVVSALAHK